MTAFVKDPDASKVYTRDWDRSSVSAAAGTGFLAPGETITTSTWLVPTGITGTAMSNTATTASIRLAGGTDGTDYVLTNRITTSAGNIEDRSITVRIRQR